MPKVGTYPKLSQLRELLAQMRDEGALYVTTSNYYDMAAWTVTDDFHPKGIKWIGYDHETEKWSATDTWTDARGTGGIVSLDKSFIRIDLLLPEKD